MNSDVMKLSKLPKGVRNALIVLAVLVALYALLGGAKGIAGMYRLHKDVGRIEEQLRETRATVDSLEREVARLKNDTAYIERTAREKLGMAHRDERIYKFVEEK